MENTAGWWELLKWHKTKHKHPLFDPSYAPENLVSLLETVLTVFFSLLFASLFVELFMALGYIDSESMLYLVSGQFSAVFVLEPSSSLITNILATFGTYLVVGAIGRESLEIYKALKHPKSKRIS